MPARLLRRPSPRRAAAAGALVALTVGVPAFAATHASHPHPPLPAQAAPQAGTATGSSTARFTPGLLLHDDQGHSTGAAEPSIEVDAGGTPYVTGPVGVPTGGCPFWKVQPDTAKGYTYEGTIDTDHEGVGGGDCDVTSTAAGHVGVSSLSLANITTNTSTDGGQTWQDPANPFGQQVFGDDRQWQAVDPSLGVTYLTVHDLYTTNIQVATSYDGGYTYLQNTPAITPDQLPAAAQDNDFSTTVVGPDHKLYIAYVAPADAAENAAAQAASSVPGAAPAWNRHVVYLAVGDPCATQCSPGQVGPIQWTDHVVYDGPTGDDYGHIFPAVTVDHDGTVYVGWAGDTTSTEKDQIEVATVTFPNGTFTASSPVSVSAPLHAHSNMFPWLAAGGAGLADVTWYYGTSTPKTSDGSCPSGYSGVTDDSSGVNNNCNQQWAVAFSQTRDGGATWSAPVTASPVVHNGSVCDQGLNCDLIGGDRTLLDFFDMALDGQGAANIAYAEDIDAPGTATIVYTRQCSGPSATDATASVSWDCTPPWTDVLTAPPAPTYTCGSPATVITDPSGDGVGQPLGTDGSSVDILSAAFADDPNDQATKVTLTIADLQQVPPTGDTDEYYYVAWTAPNGKTYAVTDSQPSALDEFYVGEFDPSSNQLKSGTEQAVAGTFNAGAPGTIQWTVPDKLIALPAGTGQHAVTNPYAVTIVGEGSGDAGGLVWVAPADRAPDAGFGTGWDPAC